MEYQIASTHHEDVRLGENDWLKVFGFDMEEQLKNALWGR